MTEALVTARDVAARPAQLLSDAQIICDRLSEGLSRDGFRRTEFSEPVRSLFQQAWAVASHKRNTQVTLFHLAYAL